VIGIDPFIAGFCVIIFDSVASMSPLTSIGLESGARNMATMLMPRRNKIIKPSRTSIKNENFATIEFEFKNSLDPDKKESTVPELKLLMLGRENPASGPDDTLGGASMGPLDPDDGADGPNGFNASGTRPPLLPLLLLLLLLLPLSPLDI
jgi:hypothetical protein